MIPSESLEAAALRACYAFPHLVAKLCPEAFWTRIMRGMFVRLARGKTLFRQGDCEAGEYVAAWSILAREGANPSAVHELADMHKWRTTRDALLRAAACAENMDKEGMLRALDSIGP